MQNTFLSTVFIESQFSNKSSLTYLKSFLIVRDLCKNYGGNIPSTKVLSLDTGLSTKTIKRHINYYLSKNWIKVNSEKETDFTLNKLYFIINVNSTCAAKGVKIPQEAYLHTTVQQFAAYLSEAVYTAKHYYHANKEKNELRNSLINPSVEYCECPDIWSKVDEELRAILYFKLDSNAIL